MRYRESHKEENEGMGKHVDKSPREYISNKKTNKDASKGKQYKTGDLLSKESDIVQKGKYNYKGERYGSGLVGKESDIIMKQAPNYKSNRYK
jgi:hypothetical protein